MPARVVRQAMRQLYIDCDGVLADFDKGATAVLGLEPLAYQKLHGRGRFWQKLAQAPDFYFGLPLMDDAMELFDAAQRTFWSAAQLPCGRPVRITGSRWRTASNSSMASSISGRPK